MRALDVRRLVSDCVSVGAHGCTHQPLTTLGVAARFEEIQSSRVEAEALSAVPVTGFAYPHGDRDAETILLWAIPFATLLVGGLAIVIAGRRHRARDRDRPRERRERRGDEGVP